ncbi:hypothetical protein DV735_g2955, partial [Chaetothyriales sp. CBS 134920]
MASLGDRLQDLSKHIDTELVVATSSAFALGLIVRGLVQSRKKQTIIPSPRVTLLPTLSSEEQAKLPYPPDSFPGARDVATPYGSIRVYEFGPETGRKVVLVHGISTPCLSLGAVANGLVERGARVLLFDLFGRGFSDNPADLPQDLRLYTTQILLALASSPLSWTGAGSGKFSIIGYSLGGGIAAGFTAYFPSLVDSLILIAPAGLVRPRHVTITNRILYSDGLIPEPILLSLAKIESNSPAPVPRPYPQVTIDRAVVHQVDHHAGFPAAFMSSFRYGPIRNQEPLWEKVGQHLTATNSKALVVLGERDGIIHTEEIREDAARVLNNQVEFRVLDAAHDVPIVRGDEIVTHIWSFWGGSDS